MKQIFIFGLLFLAINHFANSFQQSFEPRFAQNSPFLQSRGISEDPNTQFLSDMTGGRKKTSRSRRGLTNLCSSSVDLSDSDTDDHISADGDADEDEDAQFRDENELEWFFSEAEQDANRMNFPKGKPEGYYVTDQYSVPPNGFENLLVAGNSDNDGKTVEEPKGITQEEVDRLGISGTNVTLPIALMLLDGEAFPSLSRARKSCRKGHIVVNRGPLIVNPETGKEEFDQETCFKGRVMDRVYPGDVIGIQTRMHGGFYPGFDTSKPPFELPVVYEDSHFGIVNKPPGIVCYPQRDVSRGSMTIRHALPFVMKPPKRGTPDIYLRPIGVHRLDKPTSGLLIVAKTRAANVDISKQFEERKVKKTYNAIVNGIPSEPVESSITTNEAKKLGVDVDIDGCQDNESRDWQLIDFDLDEKSAVTIWRPLNHTKSLKGKDQTLTLVEMKPKTGRYHQLRRHMAWARDCPLVGDTKYDGGGEAEKLRGRGLFLCSNKVVLNHPYYNTEEGRAEWEALPDSEKWANGMIRLSEDGTTVEVHASIELPHKFRTFWAAEENRYKKFGGE